CGGLRAAHFLLRGRIAEAMRMNSLLVIGPPVGAVLWVVRPRWRSRILPWMAVGAVVAFTILRNVPVWPFVVLAPH
ncbi:MAG: DUF2752 domain-containing protein, partial [Kiritimatiellae bacterium]|nr:DUF2752 domain-containing protein [Kiritimatiellia bacterium]